MDLQVDKFDFLNDLGQDLVVYLNNEPVAIDGLNKQLEELQERWDQLVQRMEVKSKEVRIRFPIGKKLFHIILQQVEIILEKF